MLTEQLQLQSLIDYFGSQGERFDLFYTVNKGTFVTGSIRHVAKALETIFDKNNLLHKNKVFLDAGSGDGRICAIASLLGLQSYGIEYNQDILKASIQNMKNLLEKEILTVDNVPKLTQGDFLETNPYQSLALEFSKIDIFFNFVTYHESLTQKITEESPKGTIFILHSPCPVSFKPDGFKLIQEVPLTGIYQVIYIYRKL